MTQLTSSILRHFSRDEYICLWGSPKFPYTIFIIRGDVLIFRGKRLFPSLHHVNFCTQLVRKCKLGAATYHTMFYLYLFLLFNKKRNKHCFARFVSVSLYGGDVLRGRGSPVPFNPHCHLLQNILICSLVGFKGNLSLLEKQGAEKQMEAQSFALRL